MCASVCVCMSTFPIPCTYWASLTQLNQKGPHPWQEARPPLGYSHLSRKPSGVVSVVVFIDPFNSHMGIQRETKIYQQFIKESVIETYHLPVINKSCNRTELPKVCLLGVVS